jgi:hypothetical protein
MTLCWMMLLSGNSWARHSRTRDLATNDAVDSSNELEYVGEAGHRQHAAGKKLQEALWRNTYSMERN